VQAAAKIRRSHLRLVSSNAEPETWFCSHCGISHHQNQDVDVPRRVCDECSFGVLLRARSDAAPAADEPFLVVDSSLIVQAVSAQAETELGVREIASVNRLVTELLIPADAEAASAHGLADAIAHAADGDSELVRVNVRPSGAFGIRLQARIAACGPPAAALLVLG
jgi:hypothetical protein